MLSICMNHFLMNPLCTWVGLLQSPGERGWDRGEEEPSLDGFFLSTGELFSPFPSIDLGETPAGDTLFCKNRQYKMSSKTSNHATFNKSISSYNSVWGCGTEKCHLKHRQTILMRSHMHCIYTWQSSECLLIWTNQLQATLQQQEMNNYSM